MPPCSLRFSLSCPSYHLPSLVTLFLFLLPLLFELSFISALRFPPLHHPPSLSLDLILSLFSPLILLSYHLFFLPLFFVSPLSFDVNLLLSLQFSDEAVTLSGMSVSPSYLSLSLPPPRHSLFPPLPAHIFLSLPSHLVLQ